ncbi:hypothetical protein H7X87_01790 [Acetobacteraceae bacterium]|nr:hypothetical protein [Candidatus Parcubacteria bacterium]
MTSNIPGYAPRTSNPNAKNKRQLRGRAVDGLYDPNRPRDNKAALRADAEQAARDVATGIVVVKYCKPGRAGTRLKSLPPKKK